MHWHFNAKCCETNMRQEVKPVTLRRTYAIGKVPVGVQTANNGGKSAPIFHIAGHLLSRHSMAAARRIEVPGAEVKRGEHLRVA